MNTIHKKLLAGCLVLAMPLSVGALPPADAPPGPHGACDRDMKGPMGPPLGPPPGAFVGDRPPPFLMDLNLTEEQQDKVFAIMHAASPAVREQMKAARKARDSLRDLGRSVQFDGGGAATLAQNLGKAESQLALLQARTEHDIVALLTDEQRRQWAEHERDRGPREHEHEPPPR